MAVKDLPTRVYKRGEQGTFVYAPDLSVYVNTDDYGTIDLSPYVTSFTLQRNVNAPSTFFCTFDNKYARFDRVIRRMDRIVVFLKRVQWVQTFAGYISTAPWETVVPGDAFLQADCTLKRIVYTYWDPHSGEAQTLFPRGAGAISAQTSDGGAAASMFKLLKLIAGWNESQIQIQKIPEAWLAQALQILKTTEDEQLNSPDNQAVMKSLTQLLDADGWTGVPGISQALSQQGQQTNSTTWQRASQGGGPATMTGVDNSWHRLVGRTNASQFPANFGGKLQSYSGFVAPDRLASSSVFTTTNQQVSLRPDAAKSLHALYQEVAVKEHKKFDVTRGYLSFQEQKDIITQTIKANKGQVATACGQVSCPAGSSEHGWATAIDFAAGTSPAGATMNKYGWLNNTSGDGGTNPDHWEFVGNYPAYPAYINQAQNPSNDPRHKNTPSNQFNWNDYQANQTNNDVGTTAFKTAYFWPGVDTLSSALTGKRAWINDVSLMQSINDLSSASMRDFQSGPNGDFVAYFPDRLGVYGKFAAMQVRDIEIIDFKLTVSDKPLVTHYVSVGDMTSLEPHSGTDLDVLFNSGYVSVEQDEVMRLILGLPKDQTPHNLGNWIMDRFGLRPRRDDNYNIWSYGYNYMLALHRFEEAWASQWQAIAQFTFLPEIFPGMRIELVDHGLAVYVEQVVHSGSRTNGFTTQAYVSTPMRRQGDKWVLLSMEFDPAQFIQGGSANIVNDAGETVSITQAKANQIRQGRF